MEHVIDIDFQRCYKALVCRGMSLLMAMIFGLITGFGFSLAFFEQEDEYSVYSEVSCISASDISVVPFFAEVVKTANVAKRAAIVLDYEYSISEIINLIQANYRENVISGVPVIEIGAICNDPEKSVAIVNAVTEAFIAELQTLTQNETVRRLGESSRVELLYNASRTRLLVTIGTSLAFTLLLAAAIVLREILALQMTNVKDSLLNGELKLLGVIPHYPE